MLLKNRCDAGGEGKNVWDVGISIVETYGRLHLLNPNPKIQIFCSKYEYLMSYDAK